MKIRTLFSFVVLFAVSATSFADMYVVDFTKTPGKYIGRFRGCTASLIGPSHIATAAHCNPDRVTDTFYLHYDEGNYTEKSDIVDVTSPYRNDYKATDNIAWGYDWLIHKVDKDFSKNGYLGANAQASATAFVGGYGNAHKKGEQASANLSCGLAYAWGTNNRLLNHNCGTSPGHSGSPFVNAQNQIVGVLSTAAQATAFNGPFWDAYAEQVLGKKVQQPAPQPQVQVQANLQPQGQVVYVVPVQVQYYYVYPAPTVVYGYYRR